MEALSADCTTDVNNEFEWSSEDEIDDVEGLEYRDILGLIVGDIMRMVFRSDDGAYEFYRVFGKFYGFGIRKGDCGKDDDKSNVWRVRKEILEHNHNLTPAEMVHMIPNFRKMTESAKAQIHGMQAHGVPTSTILGYMAGQAGGYSFMGFNKKDAYNYVDQNPLEKFAASVYTRDLFADVKKEIEGVGVVNFMTKVRRSTTMVYTFEEYGEPGRHLVVLYDRVPSNLVCPCYFWNKKGYSCRYMFFVMKYEHLTKIPDRLVLKRLRQDAKGLEHYVEEGIDDGSEMSILL
ncbi:hypothetical protein Ahy_A08g037618 [Arachis hypogaea]|uniref:Uncharacterized protein n=1 Tax=Arachis hypogaea TaxID=3818 RepID=A0A445BRB4_ARAHY|nr:hypothetical protein Ahy_A08g037618 [Arachis hypogaea]